MPTSTKLIIEKILLSKSGKEKSASAKPKVAPKKDESKSQSKRDSVKAVSNTAPETASVPKYAPVKNKAPELSMEQILGSCLTPKKGGPKSTPK